MLFQCKEEDKPSNLKNLKCTPKWDNVECKYKEEDKCPAEAGRVFLCLRIINFSKYHNRRDLKYCLVRENAQG